MSVGELLGGLGVGVGDIGLSGLIILVVLMIFTDRLVTRQRLLDEREEKTRWRTVAENLGTAIESLSGSVDKVLVYAETTNHALTTIQELATRSVEERSKQ